MMRIAMLTRVDLKELERRFVTKEEFRSRMGNVVDEIIDLLNAFRKELKQDILELKDEFIEMRKELRDIVENHERRLDRLEDKIFT